MEVVGWGEEDGVKFWQIRNSWGTFWGDMGFFKLERGKDALFIENGDCWWVQSLNMLIRSKTSHLESWVLMVDPSKTPHYLLLQTCFLEDL